MKKVAIYFNNDNGEYYIENCAVFTGNTIPETSYKHVPARVIDESIDWRNYEKTKTELTSPTTNSGDILVVIQELEEIK